MRPARAATSVIGDRCAPGDLQVGGKRGSVVTGTASDTVSRRAPGFGQLVRRPPYAGAMIVGVGIDVVDIDRFARILARRPGLRDRLFTDAERGLPVASLAARFAAKEALAKALGAPVGLRGTTPRCSGVRASHVGMRGTVAARADELGPAPGTSR